MKKVPKKILQLLMKQTIIIISNKNIFYIPFLILFAFSQCNQQDDCDPTMYCHPVPYDSGWVDIRLSDHENDTLHLILYRGYVEEKDTIGAYIWTSDRAEFYLPINERYAAEAHYFSGPLSIISLDGGRLRQKSETNCDETCYKESTLHLDLRKL